MDEIVDERTRFEIYYPPFAGAVAAGVGSVMCSYNKVRRHKFQQHTCPSTLNLSVD